MERDPQKVSAALADPTRYNIYQYVLVAPDPVSAAEVARRFDLHPNVARMHLNRLVEVGLLVQRTEKSGRGGRPGYVYAPSGSAVSLTTVPPRDFQLLADLLVQSLALLGDGGKEAVEQIGHSFGRRLGQEALAKLAPALDGAASPTELLEACALALSRLGVSAKVALGPGGRPSLVLKSCGFHEVASAHPDHICHLCKAMVEGVAQTCTEASPGVTQAGTVPRGDKECVYEVNGLIHLE
ncbi:MAG: helix-turn-helix domain-containing protein [Symbiobacterium sp.]|uniref:helix-turn-helix transcriptional regulator n=1 Tax=Symbiobacterium sp. TaxID=1971213 RepID=UPI003463AC5A